MRGSGSRLLCAVVAAGVLLLAPGRAGAGCSLSDIGEAFVGTLKATATCKSACETGPGCAASIWLAAALGAAAVQGSDTGKGQALVDQFCKEATGTVDEVAGKLQTIFGNAVAEQIFGDFAKEMSNAGSLGKIVECACGTEQNTNALGSAIGDCLSEAMCAIGMGCQCERPAPRQADCSSIDTQACAGKSSVAQMKDPACRPSSDIFNNNATGNSHYYGYEGYSPYLWVQKKSDGTLVQVLPADNTQCAGMVWCFCPASMVSAWHAVPNPESSEWRYAFSCDCPAKTHRGPTLPSGLSSCLCDDTGAPAILDGFAPLGICPPPACPAGQVRISADGDCVTPCADPTKGMTFDGSCCDPAQMSSCGTCCPVGTVPDAKSGGCVPRPAQPK
ncbi:MAG: hypothetical protein GX458_11205 [Phyllobacteriaceae bacterium]|nr:hypothetical protein [Phyllobacteriaceae bacterium]